jgi:hypothetical protein
MKEAVMAAKRKVTVSVQPPKHRPTSSERRQAQMEAVSGKQAVLKQEAAERRAKAASAPAVPPKPSRRLKAS